MTLKRLVAQGRLGLKTGQGFYAYPQPDEGEQTETVKLETRDGGVAIAWLANPPMNAISPQVIKDLRTVWEKVKADDSIRAMVIASSIPVVYSAGADIKAFTKMDEAGGARADRRRPRAAARVRHRADRDDRRGQLDRLRRRL